ncbi:MAG: amino acid ABC transporter substrate-binding protein [Alphaproteobacteria bacterium]|nr:amino acid ABC transporter substrate-binding protein [Alphaproteobacteria bacterium]
MRPALTAILVAVAMGLAANAGADTLQTIKKSGEIKVGYRDDAPPFSFKNSVGEASGYSVGLCKAVAAAAKDELGMSEINISYIPVTTEGRFEAIQNGSIDILCGATTATLSRRALVDFSLPIFVTGAGVLTRSDGPDSFEALAGHKVGVRAGTTTEELLQSAIGELSVDAEVVPVENHVDGLKKLETGEIEAYFADRAILIFLVAGSDNRNNLRVLNQLFSHEPYALALRRGESDFRLLVDGVLSRIFRSAAIVTLFQNSFGGAEPGDLMKAMYLISPLPE